MSHADRVLIAEVSNRSDDHNVRARRSTVIDRLQQRPRTNSVLRFVLCTHKEPAHRIADPLLRRSPEFLPNPIGQ